MLTPGQIRANGTYFFVYDGSYWQVIGDFDTDTSLTTFGRVVNADGSVTGQQFGYDHAIGFRAGSNVTLTPTAATASGYSGEYYLTIEATDTTYTPASAAPLMDAASAVVGTSAKYAREDHVHPSDTTKVDKVSGKGLSTNDFTTALKNKLEGINVGNAKIFYGTTSTAASTAQKVVDCSVFTADDLIVGTTIAVYFSYGNTSSGMTLKINGGTAKSAGLIRNGSVVLSGLSSVFAENEAVYVFTYDGNRWLANNVDTNTTYTTMTQSQATTGTDTTGRLITAKVLADTIAEAQVGAAQFQYVIDADVSGHTGLPASGYKKAQYWVVKTPGTYAGQTCEAGDMIFCVNDYVSGSASNADFSVVQSNIVRLSNSNIDDAMNDVPES